MNVGNEREMITLSHSQETLLRVKENDESLTALWIGGDVIVDRLDGSMFIHTQGRALRSLKDHEGVFNASDDSKFTILSDYIAENTHLINLVHVDGRVGLNVDCLRRNSSIHKLILACVGRDISDGAIRDILQVYQEKGNLTGLYIEHANLQNGGVDILVNTLRRCTNLKTIILQRCGITDEQLLPVVGAISSYRVLEKLGLGRNNIGNAGCGTLATLLDNPNCNVRHLELHGNNIANEGAITIANGLANNKKLQTLDLLQNPFDQSAVEESFCKVLCNTSSINDLYSSNHTLKTLALLRNRIGELLLSLLQLNRGGATTADIAMKKILKHYPDMDMKPLFKWDAEEGERNLKALPYVVDWFERVEKVIEYDWNNYDKELYNEPYEEIDLEEADERYVAEKRYETYVVEKRKLDAINQFARAMPLLFEGVSTMEERIRGLTIS